MIPNWYTENIQKPLKRLIYHQQPLRRVYEPSIIRGRLSPPSRDPGLDFSKAHTWPLEDGSLGLQDITDGAKGDAPKDQLYLWGFGATFGCNMIHYMT